MELAFDLRAVLEDRLTAREEGFPGGDAELQQAHAEAIPLGFEVFGIAPFAPLEPLLEAGLDITLEAPD